MSSQRVLVVNSVKEVRASVANSLHEEYDVALAATGHEALGLLQDGPVPSAILVDFLLPDLEADEFISGMRSNPRLAGIPIIAMTGLFRRAGTENADAQLRRPFRASDLNEVLSRLRVGATTDPERLS